MFLRVPVTDIEVSLLLASGVSVAVGFAEGAYRVLTCCVVVAEVVGVVRQLIGEIRIAYAHRLVVGCRELGYTISHQLVVSALYSTCP